MHLTDEASNLSPSDVLDRESREDPIELSRTQHGQWLAEIRDDVDLRALPYVDVRPEHGTFTSAEFDDLLPVEREGVGAH
jgi:hypothetical protein